MKYTITQSRLLYVMSIDDRKHKDLLKVGEVFVDNEVAEKDTQTQAKAVREILNKRSYMQGITYKLEYVECTTYNQSTECYKADDVYRTLTKMGVASVTLKKIGKEDADIWFAADAFEPLASIKKAISEIKAGRGAGYGAIKFRPEQDNAIKATMAHFKKSNGKAFLWNAKMRFGKTLSGLQVAKEMGYKSTLIITHRPVVDDGWSKDFEKIFRTKEALEEYKKLGLEPAYGRRMMDDSDSHGDFYTLMRDVDKGKKVLVFFVSMQYLRLSQFVGGKEKNFDPLKKDIMQYDWDFVMVDEAHEGIEAAAGVRVMEKLKKEKTRILSLSGTPFNLLDKYEDGAIYTWDYVMEQNEKAKWDDEHFGDPNPYADLPRMQILTFTLPKMVRDAAIENNEVFKFHEFFRVWTEDDKKSIQRLIDCETNALKKIEFQAKLAEIRVDKFIHEGAIKLFLDKLVEESDTSLYPFSTDEFRENFKHTFWLLPGVKEAAALKELLDAHEIFGTENGMFHIINAAGDGNIEDKDGSALADVEDNIRGNAKKNITKKDYTITLSCGKLTTGVSVPEWTAVLCMKGSENTPAANYMQTIFRVQTHAVLDGRQKSDCYVFDFAPDRALTAVAETAKMAVYAQGEKGKKQLKLTQKKEEEHLQAFIKLCPVLSMDEGEMGKPFSANKIFEKLSNVYIERAVRSGYSDNSLYNPDQLMNLTPEQEKALGDVHDLLGSMPASWKPEKININKNGLGNVEGADQVKYIYYLTSDASTPACPVMSDKKDEKGCPTTESDNWSDTMCAPTQMFPYLFVSNSRLIEGTWTTFTQPVLWKEWVDKDKETDEAKKKRDEENKEKRARMSVLRGVSIRIPLLVYGAEINDDDGEEITIDNFASDEIVDDASWEEFMPKGFTKATFNILKDCFDRSIFTGAAKRIRQMVKEADNLNTEDRINKIATIFSYFHNPDKETVLTPWRVVNMHMSDCLGGWCFFNEEFDGNYTIENKNGEEINGARFVDRGQVTQDVFGDYNARILEINSKTGLYPLYMAYSIFKNVKEPLWHNMELTGERGKSRDAKQYNQQAGNDLLIWSDVLQDNIFVICRTKMAVSITKRTLAGFRKDIRMNVKCYEREIDVNDLVSTGVLKAEDEGITKNGNTYYYNEHKSLMCDMINVLRAKPELFKQDIVQGKTYWDVYDAIPQKEGEDINNMKFSAIVGNPPYQLMGGSGGNNDAPIYQVFSSVANQLTDSYSSLIEPSRWFAAGRENLLGEYRVNMLNCGKIRKLKAFSDGKDIFTNVEIKGGICYYLYDKLYHGMCEYSLVKDGDTEVVNIELNQFDILIREPQLAEIVKQVIAVTEGREHVCWSSIPKVDSLISSDTPFGIPSNPRTSKKTPFAVYEFPTSDDDVYLYHIEDNKRKVEYVKRADIQKNQSFIDMPKVFIPGGYGAGESFPHQILGVPELAPSASVCSQSYLFAAFDTDRTARNFVKYLKTRFFRALVLAIKITQSAPERVYRFVPLQNFSNNDDINWDCSISDIEKQLYERYCLSDRHIDFIERMIKIME